MRHTKSDWSLTIRSQIVRKRNGKPIEEETSWSRQAHNTIQALAIGEACKHVIGVR